MNAALAVRGNYAYVGSRTDGPEPDRVVYVVDISKPSAPEVVHEIGPPQEGNEGETSREMRIWPEKDLLIVMNLGSNCSELIHWCSLRKVEDNFRFYDISGKRAAKPKLVAEYKPSQDPHEFYLWDDPDQRGRALMFMSTPGSDATSLLVTDISDARKRKFKELGSQVSHERREPPLVEPLSQRKARHNGVPDR
jgi:LVIVD repeat